MLCSSRADVEKSQVMLQKMKIESEMNGNEAEARRERAAEGGGARDGATTKKLATLIRSPSDDGKFANDGAWIKEKNNNVSKPEPIKVCKIEMILLIHFLLNDNNLQCVQDTQV
jgi:hypothetical protein